MLMPGSSTTPLSASEFAAVLGEFAARAARAEAEAVGAAAAAATAAPAPQ